MRSVKKVSRVLISALVATAVFNPFGAAAAEAASCYQKVQFYNGAGVTVSKFGLQDENGEFWGSPNSYNLGSSVTIDISRPGIKEGATVTPFYLLAGSASGEKGYGRPFVYCVNGVTASEHLYGSVFDLTFEAGADIYD